MYSPTRCIQQHHIPRKCPPELQPTSPLRTSCPLLRRTQARRRQIAFRRPWNICSVSQPLALVCSHLRLSLHPSSRFHPGLTFRCTVRVKRVTARCGLWAEAADRRVQVRSGVNGGVLRVGSRRAEVGVVDLDLYSASSQRHSERDVPGFRMHVHSVHMCQWVGGWVGACV